MEKKHTETMNKSLRISISVFCCVFLLKAVFDVNPFYAAIATVSCLQGTIKDSFKVGIERVIGTIFGGVVGLLCIYFIKTEPDSLKGSLIIAFSITLIVFGCTHLLKKPASNNIACIVFLGITTNMDGRNPYFWAERRIITTIIGVIIALLCNYILNREYKNFLKKKSYDKRN